MQVKTHHQGWGGHWTSLSETQESQQMKFVLKKYCTETCQAVHQEAGENTHICTPSLMHEVLLQSQESLQGGLCFRWIESHDGDEQTKVESPFVESRKPNPGAFALPSIPALPCEVYVPMRRDYSGLKFVSGMCPEHRARVL